MHVEQSCRDAARQTQLTVICPPIAPAGGVINDPNLWGPQIVTANSYSVSLNNGMNPGFIHWEFGAIEGPINKLWVFDRSQWAATGTPPPVRKLGTTDIAGYRITSFAFPENDGQLAGHDLATASQNGISYFVSLHYHTHNDANIAILLSILLANKGSHRLPQRS
ncbi:MAG TPA: hypothetical protein VHV75_15270 [Solirubrobacteraceae bacterium]|nr:hypothetical protein [Solirubrobacteraceae bacterium]